MNLSRDQINQKLNKYTNPIKKLIDGDRMTIDKVNETINLITNTFGVYYSQPSAKHRDYLASRVSNFETMYKRYIGLCGRISELPYITSMFKMDDKLFEDRTRIDSEGILSVICFETCDPTDKNQYGASKPIFIDVIFTEGYDITIVFVQDPFDGTSAVRLFSYAVVVGIDHIEQVKIKADIKDMDFYVFAMYQSITDLVNHKFEKKFYSNEPVCKIETRFDIYGNVVNNSNT